MSNTPQWKCLSKTIPVLNNESMVPIFHQSWSLFPDYWAVAILVQSHLCPVKQTSRKIIKFVDHFCLTKSWHAINFWPWVLKKLKNRLKRYETYMFTWCMSPFILRFKCNIIWFPHFFIFSKNYFPALALVKIYTGILSKGKPYLYYIKTNLFWSLWIQCMLGHEFCIYN